MSYRSAEKVLPFELIELIQQYVDGDYLYIPRKESKRKKWGENTAIIIVWSRCQRSFAS